MTSIHFMELNTNASDDRPLSTFSTLLIVLQST